MSNRTTSNLTKSNLTKSNKDDHSNCPTDSSIHCNSDISEQQKIPHLAGQMINQGNLLIQ